MPPAPGLVTIPSGEPGRLVGTAPPVPLSCPPTSSSRDVSASTALGVAARSLRTNLWLVPRLEVLAAVALYVGTHALDQAAYDGSLTLPSWMIFGTADAARQILTTLAAAVITVVGVVFSITIVTLTLASTQFGPRMLRNFIRDRGTQFTLGTFVATFVYATLVLISIGPGSRGQDFVPHLSITIAVALVALSMAVLIYFIHHIATSIQLPQVIATIASDLSRAIDAESGGTATSLESGPSVAELLTRMDESGGTVPRAVERLPAVHPPRDAGRAGGGEGRRDPPAASGPATSSCAVTRWRRSGRRARPTRSAAALRRAHITGPNRTLAQDLAFAVDQLVEIAIRALSPGRQRHVHRADLHRLARRGPVQGHDAVAAAPRPPRRSRLRARDHGARQLRAAGRAGVREDPPGRTRHAGRADPPARGAHEDHRRHRRPPTSERLLLEQARMILQASNESVPEPADRARVQREYEEVLAALERAGGVNGAAGETL